MARILGAAAACASFCVSACVQVPQNVGPANVRFDQVVKRIKCDLMKAVYFKARQDPVRFGFLTQWSAKVHMTLAVDDQASVNPGLTLTEPLAVAGTSFSLGVGGTFTGQVVRTEEYEFFLLFTSTEKELASNVVYEQLYDSCAFPPGVLLESNLDFPTIIDRALSPVEAGVLTTGTQVGPNSSSSPPLPPGEKQNIQQALDILKGSKLVTTTPQILISNSTPLKGSVYNELFNKIQGGTSFKIESLPQAEQQPAKDEKKTQVADAIANATKIEENTQLVIKTVVNPLYDLATATNLPKPCLTAMLSDRIVAVAKAAAVSINKVNIDDADPQKPEDILKNFQEEKDARTEVLKKAQSMLDRIGNCKEPQPKPEKPVVLKYDPIELIQETVNFYITASGSVAPSWKLVKISAPLGLPLLSGTAKTTDTLIITMGRPAKDDNGKAVASRAMENSLSASLISQAINQRLAP